MFECISCINSFGRIFFQQTQKKIFGISANFLPSTICEFYLMSLYLIKSVLSFGASKGRLGGQEDIEDDTTAPKVTFVSEISFNNLGRHVADSSHKLGTLYFMFDHSVSSSKVKQFDLNLLSVHLIIEFFDKNNIFQFEISMHYSNSFEVVEATK